MTTETAKKYEMMTVADVSSGEDKARDVSNKIKDLITSKGGKILDTDVWGRRKFAYEIKHKSEGYYEVLTFESKTSVMPALKKKLNYVNGLVRYLITATQ